MNAKVCADWIKKSKNIVALTGAGISTSVGIPDFRGPNGIYVTRKYDPVETFDIDYFYKNPKPFFDFTRDLLSLSVNAEPSFTHYFLKKLEDIGKLRSIITQNVDMLHQKAGNKNVYEIHGTYLTSRCTNCGKIFDFNTLYDMIFKSDVPICDKCGGLIKPDIVFFGESVKFLEKSLFEATNSDLLLVIGTSLKIYPASIIPHYAKNIIVVSRGSVSVPKKKVILKSDSDIDKFFMEVDSLLE
jgi:NAD-dependent deacetylase